jgi:hypothetical protein
MVLTLTMKEALFIEVTESKILTMTMLKALLKLNCRGKVEKTNYYLTNWYV